MKDVEEDEEDEDDNDTVIPPPMIGRHDEDYDSESENKGGEALPPVPPSFGGG